MGAFTMKGLHAPTQKTWSVFAEAFDAEARGFGISTPNFSLAAIISCHLT